MLALTEADALVFIRAASGRAAGFGYGGGSGAGAFVTVNAASTLLLEQVACSIDSEFRKFVWNFCSPKMARHVIWASLRQPRPGTAIAVRITYQPARRRIGNISLGDYYAAGRGKREQQAKLDHIRKHEEELEHALWVTFR
jgi:hypothetical protein